MAQVVTAFTNSVQSPTPESKVATSNAKNTLPTPKQAEQNNVAKSRPKPKRRWAKLPTGMYGWTTSRGEGAS
jgi:hypothetical protein